MVRGAGDRRDAHRLEHATARRGLLLPADAERKVLALNERNEFYYAAAILRLCSACAELLWVFRLNLGSKWQTMQKRE